MFSILKMQFSLQMVEPNIFTMGLNKTNKQKANMKTDLKGKRETLKINRVCTKIYQHCPQGHFTYLLCLCNG